LKKHTILYILALIQAINIVDSMIIMPLGDIFIELYSINSSQYSLLVSAYALAAACSSIFAMLYLDFFDRKNAILLAFTGFSVGTLLCAFAHSYHQLLGLRFFTGLFGGVLGAIILSIVADLFPFKERGKAMGIVMAAFSAASAVGVPFGLYLADIADWRYPFYILGGVGILLSILIYSYFPNLKGHLDSIDQERKPIDTVLLLVRDSNQINALVTGMMLVLGHFLIIPFITPYMIRNVGLEQEQIKFVFLVGGIATIFTAPLIGRMTDKYGVMRVLITLMALSIFPVIGITHLGENPIWIALIATTAFFVLGSGRFIPPNTIISAAATPQNRGSFMSMKSALQQLAIALSSAIAGYIVYFDGAGRIINYNYVGYISILICIFAVFLTKRINVAEGN